MLPRKRAWFATLRHPVLHRTFEMQHRTSVPQAVGARQPPMAANAQTHSPFEPEHLFSDQVVLKCLSLQRACEPFAAASYRVLNRV